MTDWTPRTREQAALRLTSPDWKMASGLHVALVMGQIALPGKNVAELEAALEAMTPRRRGTVIELIRRWNQLMADAKALEASIDSELEAKE